MNKILDIRPIYILRIYFVLKLVEYPSIFFIIDTIPIYKFKKIISL